MDDKRCPLCGSTNLAEMSKRWGGSDGESVLLYEEYDCREADCNGTLEIYHGPEPEESVRTLPAMNCQVCGTEILAIGSEVTCPHCDAGYEYDECLRLDDATVAKLVANQQPQPIPVTERLPKPAEDDPEGSSYVLGFLRHLRFHGYSSK